MGLEEMVVEIARVVDVLNIIKEPPSYGEDEETWWVTGGICMAGFEFGGYTVRRAVENAYNGLKEAGQLD